MITQNNNINKINKRDTQKFKHNLITKENVLSSIWIKLCKVYTNENRKRMCFKILELN